jgi:hypothetical protein
MRYRHAGNPTRAPFCNAHCGDPERVSAQLRIINDYGKKGVALDQLYAAAALLDKLPGHDYRRIQLHFSLHKARLYHIR